jgi:hypothetical protein
LTSFLFLSKAVNLPGRQTPARFFPCRADRISSTRCGNVKNLPLKNPQGHRPIADKGVSELTMQDNCQTHDLSGFSFQVDLLNLNLQLAQAEKAPEPQTKAHEAALAQIRTLAGRA